jgi:hypothetical protein
MKNWRRRGRKFLRNVCNSYNFRSGNFEEEQESSSEISVIFTASGSRNLEETNSSETSIICIHSWYEDFMRRKKHVPPKRL